MYFLNSTNQYWINQNIHQLITNTYIYKSYQVRTILLYIYGRPSCFYSGSLNIIIDYMLVTFKLFSRDVSNFGQMCKER